MKQNWIFLTSSIGGQKWNEAAVRLVEQVQSLGFFEKCVIVTEKDLPGICPQIFRFYSSEELTSEKNFGYYSWKSSIAKAALFGFWGNYDGVMYLDAGSEFQVNRYSVRIFQAYISNAQENGITAFTINTPERSFTKAELFREFPKVQAEDETPQFQAGGWFLFGKKGTRVAMEWDECTWKDRRNVDASFNPADQIPNFIAPRYDQSVFSLTCKSNTVEPFYPAPASSVTRWLDSIRAYKLPILWLRNQTSKSQLLTFAGVLRRLLP
jgi:hypothetical protein